MIDRKTPLTCGNNPDGQLRAWVDRSLSIWSLESFSSLNWENREVRQAGFEPATRCLEGSRSIPTELLALGDHCARGRSRVGHALVAVREGVIWTNIPNERN